LRGDRKEGQPKGKGGDEKLYLRGGVFETNTGEVCKDQNMGKRKSQRSSGLSRKQKKVDEKKHARSNAIKLN